MKEPGGNVPSLFASLRGFLQSNAGCTCYDKGGLVHKLLSPPSKHEGVGATTDAFVDAIDDSREGGNREGQAASVVNKIWKAGMNKGAKHGQHGSACFRLRHKGASSHRWMGTASRRD